MDTFPDIGHSSKRECLGKSDGESVRCLIEVLPCEHVKRPNERNEGEEDESGDSHFFGRNLGRGEGTRSALRPRIGGASD
ncbi:hypothetical protein CULT_90074 [[Clostridium] ultunense Esp]|nr:hypothetical protein CULT_90074 [[Clostridium] ultunense Esp]